MSQKKIPPIAPEKAIKRIEEKYRKVLNDNIPRAVEMGFNAAFHELYEEFIRGCDDGNKIDIAKIDVQSLAERIKSGYLKSRKQYEEAETEIAEATYFPEENIQVLKNVMGDNFEKVFGHIEGEDDKAPEAPETDG